MSDTSQRAPKAPRAPAGGAALARNDALGLIELMRARRHTLALRAAHQLRSLVGVDDQGRTALHWAAILGWADVALLLLRKGMSPHVKDGQQRVPLHHAAMMGHTWCCKLLLSWQASPNVSDVDAMTPLHWAVSNQKENGCSTLMVLIQAGAHLNAENLYGRTPLHEAVTRGREDVCERLLLAGADPCWSPEVAGGQSPLEWAMGLNKPHVVSVLVRAAAARNGGVAPKVDPVPAPEVRAQLDQAQALEAIQALRAKRGERPATQADLPQGFAAPLLRRMVQGVQAVWKSAAGGAAEAPAVKAMPPRKVAAVAKRPREAARVEFFGTLADVGKRDRTEA